MSDREPTTSLATANHPYALPPDDDVEYIRDSLFVQSQKIDRLELLLKNRKTRDWIAVAAIVLCVLCECHLVYNESRGLRVLVRDEMGNVWFVHQKADEQEMRQFLTKFIRHAIEVSPRTVDGDVAQAKRMFDTDLRAKKEMEWDINYCEAVHRDGKLKLFDFTNAIIEPIPGTKNMLWNISSNYTTIHPDKSQTQDKIAYTVQLKDAPREEGNFWKGLLVADYQPIPLTKQK